jgi:hypothetical protein
VCLPQKDETLCCDVNFFFSLRAYG